MIEKLKVVIIDSGFVTHKDINTTFNGISLKLCNGEVVIESNITDSIGHGTAITFLINKHLPNADIFCIKIYEDEYCKPQLLVAALNYIFENIDCNIINISLGTISCPSIPQLKISCDKLINKGIIIVSAFDNNGTISYPAAFKNVIGVDVGSKIGNIKDYIFIENSPVNIMGYHREQRLPWLDNSYQLVSGASFVAPYIMIHISQLIEKGYCTLNEINEQLRKKAKEVVTCKKVISNNYFSPHKAIIFPFNKEIHSIARYYNSLKFEIEDFYDVKYIGNIGKSVAEIVGGTSQSHHQIKNYLEINWESNFDTLILGHTQELSEAINFDLKEYFLSSALTHNKHVISFDSINESYCQKFFDSGLNIYFPHINNKEIPGHLFGKLRKIGKPIIAVVGTGPRQGKFTLQMSIKTILENSGYSVGMLGTEPSSLLLGAHEVYPMGYGSTIEVNGYDAIKVINNLLGRIEDIDPEIIIVGSQSQSVPFTDSSLKYLPIAQHEFLLATAPDCFILCINLNDELLYIKRTIIYLESLFGGKVLALATLPLDHAQKWSVISNKKIIIPKEEVRLKISQIKNFLSLDVYDISDEDEMINLTENVVNHFANIE